MDNGSEFKNQEMKLVCETLGVKHIFSQVYTSESNGWTGRMAQVFQGMHCKAHHGGGVGQCLQFLSMPK